MGWAGRTMCSSETWRAKTLQLPFAPRYQHRVSIVRLPGIPGGCVPCHHKTDLGSSQHQCSCDWPCIWDKMWNKSSADSLYAGDFKEHLVTCYYIDRQVLVFIHFAILIVKKKRTLIFQQKRIVCLRVCFISACVYIYSCIYKRISRNMMKRVWWKTADTSK